LVRVSRRWATASVAPGTCAIDGARDSGRAGVLRQRYAVDSTFVGEATLCYGQGLAFARDSSEIVAVGAADAFRHDRLHEHDNRARARGLLGSRSRVVWLALRERSERREPPRSPTSPYTAGNEGYGDGNPDEGGGLGRGPNGDGGDQDGSNGRHASDDEGAS